MSAEAWAALSGLAECLCLDYVPSSLSGAAAVNAQAARAPAIAGGSGGSGGSGGNDPGRMNPLAALSTLAAIGWSWEELSEVAQARLLLGLAACLLEVFGLCVHCSSLFLPLALLAIPT